MVAERLIAESATIALGIIGLATIAVLVSRNANTAGVIGAASKGLQMNILAAVSPVSGGGGFGLSN